MTDTLTVQPAQSAPVPTYIQPNAMSMLAHAVDAGNTEMVKTLAHLASLEREKNEVAAFNHSMHAAQGEMRRIGADATNPQTRSKYVTFAKMDAALRPIYTSHGFSVSFNTAPGASADMLRVVAYVSHEQGYTREYQIDMPADGKGAKGGDVMTKTHATGAAASYGARYLLKMIFNVAVGETDDDGNGTLQKHMPEHEFVERRDLILASPTKEDVQMMYKAAREAADRHGDADAAKEFNRIANERVRALKAGAQ